MQIFTELPSAYQCSYGKGVPPLAYLAISKRLHDIAPDLAQHLLDAL